MSPNTLDWVIDSLVKDVFGFGKAVARYNEDGSIERIDPKETYMDQPEAFLKDVTESYKVAYIPYSVVSMYTTAPYTGTQPTIPVLYNPEVLEQARKKGEERRK